MRLKMAAYNWTEKSCEKAQNKNTKSSYLNFQIESGPKN